MMGEQCSVKGCAGTAERKGYCVRHYTRLRRHGSPDGGGYSRGHVIPWMHDHVSHDDDACLFWPFSRGARGHGYVRFRGGSKSASRIMCLFAHGEPPTPTHEAAHSCGNGHLACVNPKHLRWATPSENNRDKISHGTSRRGDLAPKAKLSSQQVREIRQILASGRSYSAVARQFGVSAATISSIGRRENWGWLE